MIDGVNVSKSKDISGVNFSSTAQELFNSWRHDLENRLRSDEIGCPAFESHLAKYRSLMPSLALLFWILEDPHNIYGNGSVSLPAAALAIQWCSFLEKHALKAYSVGKNAELLATKRLAECIEQGDENGMVMWKFRHGQLVEPSLFETAQDILRKDAKYNHRIYKNQRAYFLSGILFDQDDNRLHGEAAKNKQNFYYVNSKKNYRIRAERIEQTVVKYIE